MPVGVRKAVGTAVRVRREIGTVADLRGGVIEHGFADISALWHGKGRITGSSPVYDLQSRNCVELFHKDGSMTGELHPDDSSTYAPYFQKIVTAFGHGKRRLELAESTAPEPALT
jgi:hypothetical protein